MKALLSCAQGPIPGAGASGRLGTWGEMQVTRWHRQTNPKPAGNTLPALPGSSPVWEQGHGWASPSQAFPITVRHTFTCKTLAGGPRPRHPQTGWAGQTWQQLFPSHSDASETSRPYMPPPRGGRGPWAAAASGRWQSPPPPQP